MNIKLDNVFLLLFFALAGLAIPIGSFWMIVTERRLKRFFLGKKAKDLEDTILALDTDIKELKKSKEKILKDIESINGKLRKSIRGLETIRFNPFPDQGGNQSFAIGMLNEEGDGLVLSSLYSRERMSVFAKPIRGGKPAYELTTEEKEALDKAKV